jgi:lysophospholipase L1-like esterase
MFGELAFRIIPQVEKPVDSWSDRPKFYYNPLGAKNHTGQDHEKNKPENYFRIGVVGDSYSFSPFMQYSDAFPKKLESILKIAVGENPKLNPEVINYGISGYSTSNEIELVRRSIEEGSDLILLQITLNDAEIKPFKPEGRIMSFNRFGAITSEPDLGIFGYSKLLSFIYKRLDAYGSRDDYKNYFYSLYSESNNILDRQTGNKISGFEYFKRAVINIKKLSKKSKTPMVAVVFPLFGVAIDQNYPFNEIHDKLGKFLTEAKINFVDLKNSYQGIPSARLQVIPGIDFHPNEIAHRIAAEELYVWLFKNKLIPDTFRLKTAYKFRNHLDINQDDLKFAKEFLN